MTTSKESAADTQAILDHQYSAWKARPLLRRLYQGWFDEMVASLSDVSGPTVEIGCGIGTFKEWHPAAVATDVVLTRWTDQVLDAEKLPFRNGSVANVVMVDVLHHISRPTVFLAEASRVLRPGGRLIALEPYCSPVSRALYSAFHHENTDMNVDPLAHEGLMTSNPFDSNQAIPTLLFWRELGRFRSRFPGLIVVRRERLGVFAYPLSGGFSRRPLVPSALSGAAVAAERFLRPLARMLAFRCLIVLENHPTR